MEQKGISSLDFDFCTASSTPVRVAPRDALVLGVSNNLSICVQISVGILRGEYASE